MTPAHKAELEQVAKEWLESQFFHNPGKPLVNALVTFLAAQRAAVLEDANEKDVTAAMREADRRFKKVGGTTRHYVRDCLLPIMEKRGLRIVQAQERQP